MLAEVGLPALLGSGPEADVKAEGAAPRHARVFAREGEIVAEVAEPGLVLRLSGEELREAVLRDGDVIELGVGGPQLRLEAADDTGEQMLEAAPWERAGSLFSLRARLRTARRLAESATAPAARRRGADRDSPRSHTTGSRTASCGSRSSGCARRCATANASASASPRASPRSALGPTSAREALASRIDELKQREETLYTQIEASAAAETGALRSELAATRERLATLESERAVGERIVRDYGPGVCLIQGAYGFQDKDGRPLRYKLDDGGNVLHDADDNPLLDPEGKGPVHETEYVGTGFLVDRRGLVLTNRHVAEPWWNNDYAQSLIERGYVPKQTALRAFFPRERKPFDLKLAAGTPSTRTSRCCAWTWAASGCRPCRSTGPARVR